MELQYTIIMAEVLVFEGVLIPTGMCRNGRILRILVGFQIWIQVPFLTNQNWNLEITTMMGKQQRNAFIIVPQSYLSSVSFNSDFACFVFGWLGHYVRSVSGGKVLPHWSLQ
jgi:hypothetical protein